MRADGSILLEAGYAAWAAGDLDALMACFADDVAFAIHLPPEVVPFAGLVVGKEDLARQLTIIMGDFDILEYRPARITAAGNTFHSQISFVFRHKATGLKYEGTARHIWRVQDDKIVHFEEFHDTERTRAFFNLLASYASKSARSPAGHEETND